MNAKKAIILLPIVAGAAFIGWHKAVSSTGADELVVTGFVEGEERIIRSEVEGRIEAVKVREGDAVTPGTVLVTIDARLAASRMKQRELEVASLEAELEKARLALDVRRDSIHSGIEVASADLAGAEANAEHAVIDLERAQKQVDSGALAVQGATDATAREKIARAGTERARSALALAKQQRGEIAVAEADVAALEARLALEREAVREMSLQVEKHEVRAAGPGTVQMRLVQPGELATPGRALVSLLDEDDKYVRIYIPVSALRDVAVGSRVEVVLDYDPTAPLAGKVEWIDSRASFTPRKIFTRDDRVHQVYQARVRLEPGAAHAVKVGAEADVHLRPAR